MKEPIFLLAAALLSTAHGLLATSGSSCEALCRDGASASTTNTSEIVCEDKKFSNTEQGLKFKNCISCLQDSKESSGSYADVYAYLYNLRYAFDVCLYSYPAISPGGFLNTPCNIDSTCGDLEKGLRTSLDPQTENQYDYCEEDGGLANNGSYTNCLQCLRATPNQQYFSNFLVALKAGCEQKPIAGNLTSTSGDLFSTEWNTILDPADDVRNKPKGAGSSTLTTGAIVGIVAGIVLAIIGVGTVVFMRCRRRRNANREKIETPSPLTPGGPGYITNSRNAGAGAGAGGGRNSSVKMSESMSSYRTRQQMGHKRAHTTDSPFYRRDDDGGLGLGYQQDSRKPRGLQRHQALLAYAPRARDQQQQQPPMPSGSISYPLRAYDPSSSSNNSLDSSHRLALSDDTRPLVTHHARSFSQPAPPAIVITAATLPIPPPPPPPKSKSRIPALIMPSLSRAKGPKTYTPPTRGTATMPNMPREPDADISVPHMDLRGSRS
ncbi:hypothetical protein GMORB2_4563 [Geosmithia morbida]|uniref:LPXTG-domain-containing protein n=1 Tax=Geosmithia morbida TaxID=1094350 RepID=A0A9P4YRE9_9HYPO|nr:uncharacterized protein GMORB2_4563 [Geosmithia morbida]KAF4119654.1 hypothetical protein GMORB2_4563 [Geosmithia morbida]